MLHSPKQNNGNNKTAPVKRNCSECIVHSLMRARGLAGARTLVEWMLREAMSVPVRAIGTVPTTCMFVIDLATCTFVASQLAIANKSPMTVRLANSLVVCFLWSSEP